MSFFPGWHPGYRTIPGFLSTRKKTAKGLREILKRNRRFVYKASVKWIFNQEMMISGWFHEHDIGQILKVQINGKNFEYFQ